MYCYLDGKLISLEKARIDPRDRGFLLGDGVFETLLAETGRVRRPGRHFARLRASAGILGIPLTISDPDLLEGMERLLRENQLLQGRAAARITLSRGVAGRGLLPPSTATPTLLISVAETPPPPASMRAVTASYLRNEKSIGSRIKSLNYLDNIMARREAALRGADEALMPNSRGALACASAANLFVVQDGVLMTPTLDEGALPGVMRALVLETAAALGIPARETRIMPDSLPHAAEAFLSNALLGLCPLIEIDGKPLRIGDTGPLTQRLQDATADRE